MEDWAEIRRLHRSEQLGIKTIARRLGLARNTVRAALVADAPPRYERSPGGSVVDGFEPRIRSLLAQFPDMPATVIAERLGLGALVVAVAGPGRAAASVVPRGRPC